MIRTQPRFNQNAPTLACELIGCQLVVSDKYGTRGGIIAETEAYDAQDPASHSFRGKTVRNQAMFMPPGTLYIYQIYGLHCCLNIVCGDGDGQAVLIRALEPQIGIEFMRSRRQTDDLSKLCNGPANLVAALGINRDFNTKSLAQVGMEVTLPQAPPTINSSRRVGIRKAQDTPWRFFMLE